MSESSLQLAVLSALIQRYGPIPCIHVTIVRKGLPVGNGSGPSINGRSAQITVTRYGCEASELQLRQNGEVALELPGSKVPVYLLEPTQFSHARDAAARRDEICVSLLRLPWDRSPLFRALTLDDASVALRHIVVAKDALQIVTKSTEEISAWTFEEYSEKSSVEESPETKR